MLNCNYIGAEKARVVVPLRSSVPEVLGGISVGKTRASRQISDCVRASVGGSRIDPKLNESSTSSIRYAVEGHSEEGRALASAVSCEVPQASDVPTDDINEAVSVVVQKVLSMRKRLKDKEEEDNTLLMKRSCVRPDFVGVLDASEILTEMRSSPLSQIETETNAEADLAILLR